jgi:hypothetical protein
MENKKSLADKFSLDVLIDKFVSFDELFWRDLLKFGVGIPLEIKLYKYLKTTNLGWLRQGFYTGTIGSIGYLGIDMLIGLLKGKLFERISARSFINYILVSGYSIEFILESISGIDHSLFEEILFFITPIIIGPGILSYEKKMRADEKK